MAYQPLISTIMNIRYLQQQKLKWLISQLQPRCLCTQSTIVEIKMAYQPRLWATSLPHLQQQKLKWLISQLKDFFQNHFDLQQQKLKWLISRQKECSLRFGESTIVEIKMAYQPIILLRQNIQHLQQQKLKWLISLSPLFSCSSAHLQQQKLKWLISP